LQGGVNLFEERSLGIQNLNVGIHGSRRHVRQMDRSRRNVCLLIDILVERLHDVIHLPCDTLVQTSQ